MAHALFAAHLPAGNKNRDKSRSRHRSRSRGSRMTARTHRSL
ncbi:hypothetical protein [Saccharopolyspora oryzae]|uniref:Uncharacterized protein n=1 Tax=Saccharopolyspora oryzae TaxID=2997343 RepID=A0ABT4UUE5_9PSEU|nr:hypothetical protein [Saccharopolyspora oryzae]MDA3625309.1 hypothetical protein [Saccharopolyspora oryzae]